MHAPQVVPGSESAGSAPLREVAARLAHTYPEARTELDHEDAFQLLVATVLSAQTTDVRVNAVTPALFARWPDARALAAAGEDELEPHLRPLGMGPTRARRLAALGRALTADHDGTVPSEQSALESLPGVGRKTALVVRGAWFGQSALAVDTHVMRLAGRLGWTERTTAGPVERDVVTRAEAADREAAEGPTDLSDLSLRLILLGRRICTARRPDCPACPLQDVCPSSTGDTA
ncbi:MAG: endonuclease III [Brachybacterium sp.]|nr:endonuclease III [Brachybacterium sp.]